MFLTSSGSVYSLLVDQNVTQLCVLTFYSAVLVNSLPVDCLGSSVRTIMLSANRDCFTSFPGSLALVFALFVCFALLAVTRIFSALLNDSGGSGHPCLHPVLEERKGFSLSSLSVF